MNAKNKSGFPISAVFGNTMNPDYIESVIDRALDHRDKANEGTKSRLNAAIKNSAINLPGFRDTSRAPNRQLRNPMILEMMKGNDRLAGAALISWMESEKPLRDAASKHLKGKDIPTGGIDARKGEFESLWDRSEWEGECAAFAENHADFDKDDIALMLCCVSGKLPEPPGLEQHLIESELFKGWIEDLKNLDSEADDWLDLDLFKIALSDLGESKKVERVTAQSEVIVGGLSEISERFPDELQYLGVQLATWPTDDRRYSKATFKDASEFVGNLKEGLDKYKPIRPQAPTREEEMKRASERENWEKAIIEASERWSEFINNLAEALPDDEDAAEDARASEKYEAKYEALQSEIAAQKSDLESAKSDVERMTAEIAKMAASSVVSSEEYETLKRDVERLTSDNERLRGANTGLQADKGALSKRISGLRNRLAQSQRMEEMWRQSYEAERVKQSQAAEMEPSELESVADALELAEKSFPDQLLIALNSKSDKNSPFQKPDEVFGALKWLATEYHDLRANPIGSDPGFNMLVKQACPGWSYKPGQTEVTKEQFNQWYTTWHDGKTYDLKRHLAKGTSHDPQNTIRIAFEWDDDLNKVVVGFLGLHQRNRRSA